MARAGRGSPDQSRPAVSQRMTPVRFRPHHFLCAIGFEGKGYSDVFTANMAQIIGGLRAKGGGATVIEVQGAADDICGPCPLRRGLGCENQAKIDQLDAAHAAALGLAPGDVITWDAAQDRIAQRIAPDDLDQICAGCSWLPMGMCKRALRDLKATKNAAR